MEAATKHEKTTVACARAHQTIIYDTTCQEVLLEDAAKERERIISILMRKAEVPCKCRPSFLPLLRRPFVSSDPSLVPLFGLSSVPPCLRQRPVCPWPDPRNRPMSRRWPRPW